MIHRRHLTSGLAAAVGAGLLGLPGAAAAKPKIGQPAPKFTLHTFDRRKVTLADLAGKVIVLNFWAVWCGPCKHELPLIDAYVRAYAKRHGPGDLQVFATTVDETVSDAALRPLADTLSFPLATRIDGGGYGPIDGAVPSNFVIDRQGVLRYAKAEAFEIESFAAVVGPLLAQSQTTLHT